MKKAILVIMAAALVLSLCMINSFADSSIKHVSRDQLTIVEDNNIDVAAQGGNPDPTEVDLTAYTGKTLRIWGWVGTVSPINGFGYKINGGELVTGDFSVPAEAGVVNAATNVGATQSSRYQILVPITDGAYTVDAYCIMESGTEKIWSVEVNGGDPNNVTYKWANAASESNIGLWMRNLHDKAIAKFTTSYAFDAVRLPVYWASTMANQGSTPIFSLSVYANAANVDLALEAAPLVTKTFEAIGDGDPPAVFEFDTPLEAGTYYFVVETVGTNGKDFDGTNSSAYLVIPTASSSQGESFNMLATGKHAKDPINFSIRAAKKAPYGTNPQEETAEISNIDFVLLYNGSGWTENLGKGSNLGQLKKAVEAGANSLYIVGWYLPAANLASISYQVDGGELVPVGLTFNQGTADVISGWGYNGDLYRNYDALIPLQEGAHTVKLIATLVSGRSTVIYQTSYKNDDTDIALGKPVYMDLVNGFRNGSGFWLDEYINDGFNPVFNTAVIGDVVPLGVYPFEYPAGSGMTAKIYIDLQGVYDITEIDLHAQGFQNVLFPKSYDLYTSLDGLNWTLVASVEGRTGDVDSAEPFVFKTESRGRFVLMDIKEFNEASFTLGEIEVYGTFVEESDVTKAGYLPYKTYEGAANTGDAGGQSSWTGYSTGTLTHSFVFNTDVSFYRIGFPAFWAAPGAPIKIEFIKDGETVCTVNYVAPGDGGFTKELGQTLEAGEYICKMTITDDTVDASTGYYANYFVIGYANEGLLGSEYVATERGQIAFDIYSEELEKEGFIRRTYKQHVNVDAIQLDGVDQETGDNIDIVVEKDSNQILVHGWLAANFPVEKYGYKVDGGEAVYDDSFINKDPGTADNPNLDYAAIMNVAKGLYGPAGNGFRADIVVPVEEGKHTVEVIAFVDGEERHIRAFTYDVKPATEFVEYMSRDQITVDGADKASVGGNAEVTSIEENLFDLAGKQLRIWGWYANNKGLDKYGVKVDGGDIVYFDRYEAEDIVNHVKANLIKDDDVFASRFEIFVDITEGEHTIEVFAIANGEERLVWTVNYNAVDESEPVTEPTTEPNTQTGDTALIVIASLAVLVLSAAFVFRKKYAF